MNQKSNHGFTLLSLVVTVTIVVILAAAVYVWIDPVARVGAAKNQRRQNEVLAIATALTDYMKDHKGALPLLGGVGTTTKKVLCSSNTSLTCGSDTDGCLVIDDTDFTNKYLLNLPVDPDKSTQADTGYYVQKSTTTGRLIVGACTTYGSDIITYKPQVSISCKGYAAGYCWYMATDTSHTCNTVCSNLNLTCVAGVDYGTDTNCELNQEFHNGCDTGCNMPGGADIPPAHHETVDLCFYQSGSIGCDDNTASYYGICPCQ